MRKIYFNNSSLEELACSRRYKYRIIDGAKILRSPELSIGSAFHHVMRDITRDRILIMVLASTQSEQFRKLEQSLQITLADLAIQMRDLIQLKDSDENSVREYFFKISCGVFDPEPDWEIQEQYELFWVGTTDYLTLEDGEQDAILTDYKTTKSKIDGNFIQNYTLKSQPSFYTAGLIEGVRSGQLTDLPKTLRLRIEQGRLKFRYGFASYQFKKVNALPPTYLNADWLTSFKAMLQEKARLAVYYHMNPTAAESLKEGITNGACYFCAYKNICALNNPMLEADAYKKWPLGFAPYDPQHQESNL